LYQPSTSADRVAQELDGYSSPSREVCVQKFTEKFVVFVVVVAAAAVLLSFDFALANTW
jgi:hypothetical protein